MHDTVPFKTKLQKFSTLSKVVLLGTQMHQTQEILNAKRHAIYVKRITEQFSGNYSCRRKN